MPSLDELTATAHGGTDAPADVLAGVLATVKAEGGRRRARRHRRNAFVALLGLVVLAVPAVALLSDGDDDQQLTVAADDRSTTTATTDAPSTTATTAKTTVASTVTTQTTAMTDQTVVVAPPETAATVPGRPGTTAVPRTTVPTVVCRNSTNPACGEFRWDPSVGNASLVASFATAPATAFVGEPVTFEVDWSDPDADDFGTVHSVNGAAVGAPCSTERRYGPWTPPPAQPGSGRVSFTETFAAAGTYRIVVDLWTGNVCDHPHASEAHVVTTVTVTDFVPPGG